MAMDTKKKVNFVSQNVRLFFLQQGILNRVHKQYNTKLVVLVRFSSP
jgi:hypothetical protein